MPDEFNERRRRTRAALRWTVYLKRPAQEEEVRAETRDLSSQGFFCLSPRTFEPGEILRCTIVLPPSGEEGESRTLSGRATVLRVEPGQHLFGIACRLEDYIFDTGADPPAIGMTFHGG
jgi:PilZ domain